MKTCSAPSPCLCSQPVYPSLGQAWGDGALVMPHGLSVDRDGNVWVADAGRHQAVKFSPAGEELAAIGLRAKPGHDTLHLCKPTAVSLKPLSFDADPDPDPDPDPHPDSE